MNVPEGGEREGAACSNSRPPPSPPNPPKFSNPSFSKLRFWKVGTEGAKKKFWVS